MNKRCSRRTGVTNEKGYTLIFAVIIMAMLTIVSAAVLTSAANSLNAVNKRVEGREAYYIAKSVLNTIDSSLRVSSNSGSLGSVIRDEIYNASVSGKSKAELAASIDLNGDLEEYTVSYVSVLLDTITKQDVGTPNTNVQDERVDANVLISYYIARTSQNKYRLTAKYTFSGKRSIDKDKVVRWDDVKWELKEISQK